MTREEAIKRLELHERTWLIGGGFDLCEALRMAIAALREQDSNANQHVSNTSNALGGWISVEERLPEPDVSVLVIANGKPHENITLDGAYELAEYGTDGWILETWPEWMDAQVTHWMPLPEGPKEEV